jgi:opacity protein-like surface antigen
MPKNRIQSTKALPIKRTPRAGASALFLCCALSSSAAETNSVGTAASTTPSAAPTPPSAAIQPAIKPASSQKPAWLTDLSLGIKESYDDDLYLAGADPALLPAKYPLPAGSPAALRNVSSWVTTVSPKFGVNLAPLLSDQALLQVLSFGYAPDFVFYHDASVEDYDAHRFATTVKGKADPFSFNLENSFNYIDGSSVAPTYPGGFLNAEGIAAPRERREQVQDRSAVSLRYDAPKWFVRPTASLLYYDLMTEQHNVTGYQNYSDRYDVNGGLDFGYKLTAPLAVTLGYRYGHQGQEQFSFTPYSTPSDYHRVLVGLEGKPLKWLDVKMQAGPDFRGYPSDTATHITPVNDKDPVKYYGEASLAATITPNDLVTFKYRQFQWVSSLGKVPYFDSNFDLTYHRKITEKLGLDLGGRALGADYTSGNIASCVRNDWQYTVSAGLAYTFSSHVSANLTYVHDFGLSAQDDILNPETRAFDRNLVSAGAVVKF